MNIPPVPGSPINQIDTPALVLDLNVLEKNIRTMNDFFRNRPCRVRSVTKGHKSPAIAQRQMSAEGAIPGGLCCTKVSEAEVMIDAGAQRVRMISQTVGPTKIQRLLELARRADVIASIDNFDQAMFLDEEARRQGIRLKVDIEVDIGLRRCGVKPGHPAVELAQQVARLRAIDFVGIAAHDSPIRIVDRDEREAEIRRRVQMLLDTRDALETNGFPVQICAVGSTVTARIAGTMTGVTEVEPGSYAVMDHSVYSFAPETGLEMALSVVATVISRPTRDRAVVDCGHKMIGLSYNGEMPVVLNPTGIEVDRLNAEHGILRLEDADLKIGDRIALFPHYNGSAVNANDYYVCARDGVVETVWPIAARGSHH